MEIVKDTELAAQVVSTMKFIPDTLYFTPPGECFLTGKIEMNSETVGEATQREFLPEEIKILNSIVEKATIRQNEYYQNRHGV